MVAGVAHVHSKGIAHLDIKPANFIISRQQYRVQLIDFNLARVIPASGVIDRAGGSRGFKAPEILRNKGM